MKYSFQLCPHPNIRYMEALTLLGCKELACMLTSPGFSAISHTTCPVTSQHGNSTFFEFEANPALSPKELQALRLHSSLLLMAEIAQTPSSEPALLRPLDVPSPDVFPPDLPEVLKYKGKTSARFTRMMLSCALAAAGLLVSGKNVRVLDPLCGRGTTLLCAAQLGMDAFGVEQNGNDLKELDAYLTRYCQIHRLKHRRESFSKTIHGHGIPAVQYELFESKEAFVSKKATTVSFFRGDTSLTGELFRRHPCDLLVTDLPYGIQHAPGEAGGMTSFKGFLARVLPEWHTALRPGGALSLSMNVLTLRKEDALRLLREHGFEPLTAPPYDDFLHDVEQAVRRDFIVALRL